MLERRVMAPLTIAAVAVTVMLPQDRSAPPSDQMPKFTASGALLRPEGWEMWVMVGASTGLSYNENARPAADGSPGMFHNVYLQPWAYKQFMQTRTFPEGTMFVLSFFESSRKATPARAGFYEGDQMPGFEVHLKWKGTDKTGWGFYNFGDSTASADMIPGAASCYTCHATEAAHDHVFTQFYPPLRTRLTRASP